MSFSGDPHEESAKTKKLPRRCWNASAPFWDFRASHWAEAILALALVWVGVSQLVIYRRQATILDKQTEISGRQLTEMAAARRQAISSERARFSPTGYTLVKQSDTDPAPVVEYGFINLGRTLATMNELSVECTVVRKMPEPPVYDPAKSVFMDTVIGPSASFDTKTKMLNLRPCRFDGPVPLAAYAKGTNLFIVVFGFLKFDDIYGNAYTRRFAGVVADDGTFHDVAEEGYNVEIGSPK